MRSTVVSPLATKAAITKLAEARRSVAMTVAPVRRCPPVTLATRPSVLICAPRRRISSTLS